MRMLKKYDRFREKISGKQGWPGKSSETNQVVPGWLGTGKNKRTEGRKGLAHENSLHLILRKRPHIHKHTSF